MSGKIHLNDVKEHFCNLGRCLFSYIDCLHEPGDIKLTVYILGCKVTFGKHAPFQRFFSNISKIIFHLNHYLPLLIKLFILKSKTS